jgi:hypothetical protein
MDELRQKKLQELRRQIEGGHYVVDPTAVAAAVVRRVWGFDVAPEPAPVLPIAVGRPRARDRARASLAGLSS